MTSGRASPPTRRVVAVLDALAGDDGARPNLSTVARRADVSPATCLGILNELVAAGWVRRHDDNTYALGNALVALGAAARDGRPGLRQARAEMESLSDELGLVTTVSTVIGEQIVVLDTAGRPADDVPVVGSGTTFPFVAPVGMMFAAWSPDEAVDAWLARSPVELDPSKMARLRAVIDAARVDGHLVERLTNVERNLHEHLPSAGAPASDQAARQALSLALSIFVDRDYGPGELEAAGHGSVSVVAAPCFGADGDPELFLVVYVMRDGVPSGEVAAIAERLRAGCARVTAAMGGADPWPGRRADQRRTS